MRVRAKQGDIPSVTCILILDADGGRICCKYFTQDFPTIAEQQAFEKKVFDKSHRTNAKTEGATHRRRMPPASVAPRRASRPSRPPARARCARAAEIVLFDSLVTVYKNSSDAWFFVVSRQSENELILTNVLGALTDALMTTLRQLDKRSMLDNYESVLLTIDELIDGGMILETEASAIASRAGMKAALSEPIAQSDSHGSSFSAAFSSAKESFARSLMR